MVNERCRICRLPGELPEADARELDAAVRRVGSTYRINDLVAELMLAGQPNLYHSVKNHRHVCLAGQT